MVSDPRSALQKADKKRIEKWRIGFLYLHQIRVFPAKTVDQTVKTDYGDISGKDGGFA